jgi:hypothetical protein
MMVKAAKTGGGDRNREDRRRQLLIYMRPEMIRMLKVSAMEEGRPAYVLVEEAVEAFLKARKRQSQR